MMPAARLRGAQTQPDRAQPERHAEAAHISTEVLLKRAVAVLEDYKAQDIAVLPLAGKASFADYMVVVSGTSSRHVASMGAALKDKLKDHVLHVEGLHEGEWVCTDLGSVVVHVFLPEKRHLYNLEKLWSHSF